MASKNTTLDCAPPMKATSHGVFQGDNPLHSALPLVILQMCLVLVLTRVLAYLLKPIRQPRVVAEIVVRWVYPLGRVEFCLVPQLSAVTKRIFHACWTLANLGLLFFLFLVGLSSTSTPFSGPAKKHEHRHCRNRLPVRLGHGCLLYPPCYCLKRCGRRPIHCFHGVAMSITAFPVLARILAELKLLTTDVGKMAMSPPPSTTWWRGSFSRSPSPSRGRPFPARRTLGFLCASAFVIMCSFLVPPVFRWMSQRCPDGEPVDEVYVCATLGGVLAASFVTDTIGIHALFGAFVVGVLIPKEGAFAGALVEKVEDLVSGLFLPLYFVSSGLKTDVSSIRGARSWGLLFLVIFTACFGKIAGSVAVSLVCKIPFMEALAIGLLMNTKGLVELIVLNIGKDRGVLNDETFAILVLMALLTTFITTPLVVAVYKPAKAPSNSEYKHRMLHRRGSSTSPFRMLFCFHSVRNIPTMINLIEVLRGTGKKEVLLVHAMHLMELSERSSAILMVHKARKNGLPFWKKDPNTGSDQIVVAFEAFQHLSKVAIWPTTAISAVSSMHEDIINGAERNRAAMIVLPFHKHLRLDGQLETTRAEYRHVNRKVLEHAPCSVGILVDRGFGGSSHIAASNVDSVVTVLFFGGHDDHEALAYGARMAEHPGINLTVVRFLLNPGAGTAPRRPGIRHPRHQRIRHRHRSRRGPQHEVRRAGGGRRGGDGADDPGVWAEQPFSGGADARGRGGGALKTKIESPEMGPVGNLLISSGFTPRPQCW
ncbi:hypothetical protein OSB04_029555 [Centaurea solstitialis]|uniref:Cation/H+ exchanger domain-containing protein n=1 Tax=Centaurea solstitialis TaxID=347529 RepID=A0AA38VVW8_9ASTR|nr:hypothetical protein OSB04_029555 [Centaurea solstitialis]